MAVIDVATGRPEESHSGIRSFDIGTDLRPVAELIADAFSHELDPRGKAALREMRVMSHISGLLKLVNRSTGEFDDVFNGFVWEEDGRIVGNVTVQRADRYGSRWQIANVAVDSAYRGRGIARRLMAQALSYVESNRGQWAVLQVYEQNAVARSLYAGLGFEDVAGTADLRLTGLPCYSPPQAMPGFHTISVRQWPLLYDLASRQLNSQAQWWRTLRRSDFQLTFDQQFGEWFWQRVGRRRIYRRGIRSARRLEAAIVLTAQRWSGNHLLQLWNRPENYGLYERDLVQWALATLQAYPQFPVDISLSTEHEQGIEAMVDLGFVRRQTLVTMRRRVRE